jgi:hypothetical protein
VPNPTNPTECDIGEDATTDVQQGRYDGPTRLTAYSDKEPRYCNGISQSSQLGQKTQKNSLLIEKIVVGYVGLFLRFWGFRTEH